jgi:hypothetical protein
VSGQKDQSRPFSVDLLPARYSVEYFRSSGDQVSFQDPIRKRLRRRACRRATRPLIHGSGGVTQYCTCHFGRVRNVREIRCRTDAASRPLPAAMHWAIGIMQQSKQTSGFGHHKHNHISKLPSQPAAGPSDSDLHPYCVNHILASRPVVATRS